MQDWSPPPLDGEARVDLSKFELAALPGGRADRNESGYEPSR